MLNKYILILFLLLLFKNNYSQELNIQISTEKNEYFSGEPIIVLISITNSSNADYVFTYTFSNQQKFLIENDSGIKLKNHHEGYPGLKNDREVRLNPKEEIIHFSNITSSYGNLGKDWPFFDSFKPGKYRVQLKFRDCLIINESDTLRNESILSNELYITVKEPNDVFNAQINELEDFLKTRSHTNSELFEREFNRLISTKIISKNSEYLFFLSYLWYSNDMNTKLDSIILNNPNSYWAVQYTYKMDSRKINDLNKFKNTMLHKAVESNAFWERTLTKNKKLLHTIPQKEY
ncbi:MAG: hypothetical protein IPM56_12570 [Ignavibacteriales bacterium]|nr:MAG: hypothetical protein IPM56_12570 [Ignavibacteriales bacterium]